jgi:hypothetical protein
MTSPEVIKAIQEHYPKYSKAAHSLANRSVETGVRRTVLAERIARGLPPTSENRRYPCRISCRLPESLYGEFNGAQAMFGYATTQDFLLFIVQAVVKIAKESAPAGGNDTDKGKEQMFNGILPQEVSKVNEPN